MTVVFHPEAELELLDTVDYYESRQPGLGEDFSLEVLAALDQVRSHPRTWPILTSDVRRCLTHRFPYGVLYSENSEGIVVLAVMHLNRNPDYWMKRHTVP